ncbi:siderophore-interacting protein [Solicola sp. PLA-1-18]|uniref:siderophore-interacting protein n=1 Tax=Solicola sp. PLA-1-18 TaxID=3380532 RepID=UPI003B76E340
MPEFLRQTVDSLRKATAPARAEMNLRVRREQFPLTLTAAVDVHENLRRLTFTAPELADFVPTGLDEQCGLLLPPEGVRLQLPDLLTGSVRHALAAIPADLRPTLRWYVVRAHRPEAAEIDVEVVLHDDGPGTAWARTAEVGTQVGFRAGSSGYRPPSAGARQLLVADETALPALAAILERLPLQEEPVHSIVEVPSARYRLTIDTPYPVEWVYRNQGDPGSRAAYAVKTSPVDRLAYAWVCGEVGLATGIRKYLVKERDVDADAIFFSGFWKKGSPAG